MIVTKEILTKIALGFCLIYLGTPLALAAEPTNDSSTSSRLGGVFIEPALTYEVGNTEVNYPSPLSDSTGSLNGFGFGARVGVHFKRIFFGGVDARYSLARFTDSSIDYDASSTSTNWGPIIGVQAPIMGLRVWGSYIVFGEVNPRGSGSLDVKFQDASGYRLGVGFRLTMLSLNLEYQDVKYDQSNLESLGPFTPGTIFESVDLENKSWVLSFSFPFDL